MPKALGAQNLGASELSLWGDGGGGVRMPKSYIDLHLLTIQSEGAFSVESGAFFVW